MASGTGSVAVLYHLLQATCQDGDEVVYAWRSFEAYPIAVGLTGATDVQVPLTPRRPARPPRDAGGHHRPDQGRRGLLAEQPDRSVGAPRRARGLPRRRTAARAGRHRRGLPRVRDGTRRRRTRSRSRPGGTTSSCCGRSRKAYGLAGLRVGFAIGPAPGGRGDPQVRAAVRRLVDRPGCCRGVARGRGRPARAGGRLVAERGRVHAGLTDQGWSVPDAQGNFVWLALGSDSTRSRPPARRSA